MKKIEIKCKGADSKPYNELLPFQGNLKDLSDENYQKLKKEILELGFSEPVSVWLNDNKYHLLNGHQRHRVIKRMVEVEGYNCEPIPINIVEAKDVKEAKKKVLALTSQYGEITPDGLYEFMNESDISIEEITSSFRFPEIDLDLFNTDFFVDELKEETEDEVPEVPKESNVKLGDLFTLGEHRLLCGDSTKIEDVERLMNGEKSDMVFTDPPYGVEYKGIKNDTREGLELLLTKSFENYSNVSKNGAPIYVFHSDRCADIFHQVFRKFCHFSSMIIWKKPALVLSQTDYQSIHEPCLYGWIDGGTHKFYADRKQTSVWEFGKESVIGHTTPKPVTLIEKALLNSSEKTNSVLDLFGGSGSTLIACEKTNRKCFMMELDPIYVSVILDRFETYSNKKAYRLNQDGTQTPWSEIK